MHSSSTEPIDSFGGYRIDSASKTVLDSELRVQPLRRQSYDILLALLSRKNTIVPKNELIAAVWQDRVVTDDSLVQCIADVRRAIGDGEKKILQTLPRRGYMLVTDQQQSKKSVHLYVQVAVALSIVLLGVTVYYSNYITIGPAGDHIKTQKATDTVDRDSQAIENFGNAYSTARKKTQLDMVNRNYGSLISNDWPKQGLWIDEANISSYDADAPYQIIKHGTNRKRSD